jgi:hypothetical protein
MKKSRLIILFGFLSLTELKAQIVIPSCDFTNWATDTSGKLLPINWIEYSPYIQMPTILQDVDRANGSGYSLRVKTVFDSTVGYYNGGNLSLLDQPFTGSSNPTTLSGYIKYYDPTVMGELTVELYMYDSSHVQIAHTIAGTLPGVTYSNWTAFSKTINYTNGNLAVFYDININIANFGADSTVYGNLDDISFDISTKANDIIPAEDKINLTNTGSLFTLQLNSINAGKFSVHIVDASGRLISCPSNIEKSKERTEVKFNMEKESPGIYFCNLEFDGRKKVVSFYFR